MVPRGVAVPVTVGVPHRKVKAILKGYMSLSMERAGECGAECAMCSGSVPLGCYPALQVISVASVY